jgi:release factor glutamine methyltransferase
MISEFQQVFGKLKAIYPDQEAASIVYLLFSGLLGISKTEIYDSSSKGMNPQQERILNKAVDELLNYKPIQYVIGHTTFYDCRIICKPGVLIPRPETEELVDLFIKENTKPGPVILDIGTGSGCIAIAVKKHLPEAAVFALDISPIALEVARQNADLNNTFIHFLQADILNPRASLFDNQKFDCIISNPPYVMESQKKEMRRNVLDFEPQEALFVSDHRPLLFYESIVTFAKSYLKTGGKIFLEINELMGKEVGEFLIINGFQNTTLLKDMFGKDRFMTGEFTISSLNR